MLAVTIAALTLTLTPTPCNDPTLDGCYVPETHTIELATLEPFVIQHELAHAIDFTVLPPSDREWFRQQTASNPSVRPEERFADVYATCATQGLNPYYTGAYGASYSLTIYRRMCRRLRYHTRGISWLP